jgi:SAM-dependent methyltransferase
MSNAFLNLICPNCKTVLTSNQPDQKLECETCKRTFPVIDGVPSFIKENDGFYHSYYQTELGASWAKGHVGFKNPFLNALSEMRTKISIVGKRQRFFKKLFGREKNGLILDLGCGGGHELFSRYGTAVGVDLELLPLKNVKSIYAMAIHADITALPFEDNTFDYVVSSDVMGHIPIKNKDKLLAEIYRVLKPDGVTVHAIETQGVNFLYRFAQKYPDLFRKSFIEGIGGHFGLEMPDEVLNRFSQHGFDVLRIEKIWGPIWPTEDYIYRFDNEYMEKSNLIKLLVTICKILNKNILVHGIANVILGILNYFVESLAPLNHAQGILVAYRKPK